MVRCSHGEVEVTGLKLEGALGQFFYCAHGGAWSRAPHMGTRPSSSISSQAQVQKQCVETLCLGHFTPFFALVHKK